MAAEKQDLRVKKTQHLLAIAMLTLLEKQNFGKITVNDICTEAMISRSAFYSHFEDKYALLRFCLNHLQQITFDHAQKTDMRGVLQHMLENVVTHAKVFRHLITSELDAELIEMFQQAIHRDFERILDELHVSQEALPGPTELLSIYYGSGIANVIIFWINNDMPYSVEEMTDYLCALLPEAIQ